MVFLFGTEKLLKQQLKEVELWHNVLPQSDFSEPTDFHALVSIQHQVNFELWHQEDMARDPDVSDSIIASVKRAIDVLNQRRNDLIEQMDQFLLNILRVENVKNDADTEMNSETPGSMIDRLSINALKIYHMDEEVQRKEITAEHRNKCAGKLSVLQEQREDLEQCLSKLLADLSSGEKRLKVYRQMKMYNDESLNPVLYRKDELK
ncbi:MAG TPA: DUF4254 domain-containing protein [Deltaproteobacteria bacterium]|nr:DUF4254 domain-containing protein [SAR324 cluster bacterium]HBL56172.1 hypothetical protein [Deltaproteobacteria bacterium]HIA56729.1 DUF4254 domain-containing protein [Candidatus Lambdaproteobacteria bacterium]HIN48088.1 DUF4254 domain-containing protein [Deltaproteobacteria bacterium]HIO10691.1 DUF4254 domain-containing protein [Deltaproteobacteria bacterium]